MHHDPSKSECIVIGTSHVRGVGASLNLKKINAISLCNPGCTIPQISCRIHNMIPRNFCGNVILQVGGNDCSEVHSEMVIYRFETLLFLIRQHAPECRIYVNEVPQRSGNKYIAYKIRNVNDFLHHMSVFEDISLICHPHLRSENYLRKDGVHFNKEGYELYINNIISELTDFRVVTHPTMVT